ncbi:MAG: DNA repair and recombination protein RadB [Candidatus Hydrothermarchaeales archaeon]
MSPLNSFLAKDNAVKLPLGCCLDDILDGGIETKVITQVYGPPASGKTNLCLLAAVNCVRAGKKVVFIDTEAGRSVDRLKQLAKDDFERVLKNSYFYEPTKFKDQNIIVENLKEIIDEKFGLIVLDSAVSLYRLHMNGDNASTANKQLSRQLAKLSELARKHNLAVIITNQVYSSFEDGGVEPIGGSVLKYWSKAIVELKEDRDKKKEAILRRHRSLPQDIKTKFVITGNGFRDAN